MSKDDDFGSGSGNALKKDFKNILKHSKKMIKGLFRGRSRCNNNGCNGRRPPGPCPPFFKPRSPLLMLLYPKLIVGGVILLTLLFCGVSIYGLIIILLLTVILILI